jgi:cytochrome P450
MALFYLLLLLLLPFLFRKAKNSFYKQIQRLPPGPWSLPIIGSLHHFIGLTSLPHHALHRLSLRFGDLMFLQIGERPTIIISSIEAARKVMKIHETAFCNRPRSATMKIFTYGGKDLVLASYGDYWREIRRIITVEFLSSMRVQSFRSIREQEVGDLIQLISSELTRSPNQTINLREMMCIMTSKVAIRALTGSKRKDGTLLMREIQRSGELATGFGVANLFPSSRLASLISSQVRKTKECHRSIDLLLDSLIQEHRANLGADATADDFLSVLLRLHDERSKNAINMDTVKAIIFVSIFSIISYFLLSNRIHHVHLIFMVHFF